MTIASVFSSNISCEEFSTFAIPSPDPYSLIPLLALVQYQR